MKRAEFIKLWADTVAAGRKRNFPDIRLSEAAFARMDDEKSAAKHWNKHRASWRSMSIDEVRAVITGDKTNG